MKCDKSRDAGENQNLDIASILEWCDYLWSTIKYRNQIESLPEIPMLKMRYNTKLRGDKKNFKSCTRIRQLNMK